MAHFRNDTSEHIAGLKVKTKEDYLTQKATHLSTGEETAITLPQADLIRYTFDEGFIALRPSGTEPKIKIYFSLNVPDFNALVNNFKALYLAES